MTTKTGAYKQLMNKAYKDALLLHEYDGQQVWTTNTEIAERGEVEPRIYKNTEDRRDDDKVSSRMTPLVEMYQNNQLDPVESVVKADPEEDSDGSIIVYDLVYVHTEFDSFPFQERYINYLLTKYSDGARYSFELLPQTNHGMLYVTENQQPVAIVMGLRKGGNR